MNAAIRSQIVFALGLQHLSLAGHGCLPNGVLRNGDEVTTLGQLVSRDAAVEALGKHRVPHGVEADLLFQLNLPEVDEAAMEIALQRAHSNGRNIFWEGGPGGAASTPDELRALGHKEARVKAFERAAMWRALPECARPTEFWAWTVTPAEYWPTRLNSLAYSVWGYANWNQKAVESGLRDFALLLFTEFKVRPTFGRGSEFWSREGKNVRRNFRWGHNNQYVETTEDIAPGPEWAEAGLIPADENWTEQLV